MKATNEQPHIHDAKSGLQAWQCGEKDGRAWWVIATESPTSTLAEAFVVTESHRKPDVSGEKAFRVCTKTTVRLSLRVLWNESFEFAEDFVEYEGEIGTLRRTMAFVASKSALIQAKLDLESQARKAGASEYAILNTWDENDKLHCANLMRLLKRQAA